MSVFKAASALPVAFARACSFLTERFVWNAAQLVASLVAAHRTLAWEYLDDEECEERGLPHNTKRTDAVFVRRLAGLRWWEARAWLERDEECEGAVHFDLFGYETAIYYLRKGRTYEWDAAGA